MRGRNRVSCIVRLWGHQRSSPHSDISPLEEEINVFSTLGTFLWYLTTRVFYIATEYPTKCCVLEILSSILYHIEYSVGNSTNVEFLKILSNILYPIEYSYGYTEVPTGYPTLSIAYLIYSTSHVKAFV